MSNRRAALVEFVEPVLSSDGQGGRVSGWVSRFQRRTHVRYLRGSETVIASRLGGVQPVVLRIRNDVEAQSITTKWRIRFPLRGEMNAQGDWVGDSINIKAIVPTDDHRFIEVTGAIGEPA